jgi:hypothetical protein
MNRLRRGLGIGALLLLWGCASNGVVHETIYTDGFQTDTATVQAAPNGGYQTLQGDPVVVARDDVELESDLPYGGGEEGIRRAEDDAIFDAGD